MVSLIENISVRYESLPVIEGIWLVHDEWDPNLAKRPLLEYARTHRNLIVTPHIGGGSLESITGARIFGE